MMIEELKYNRFHYCHFCGKQTLTVITVKGSKYWHCANCHKEYDVGVLR